jgi:hypothetical protein
MEKEKNRNANQRKRGRKEAGRESRRKREKRTRTGTKEKGAKWSLERVKVKKNRMGPREMRGIEGKSRNRRTIERRAIPKLQWEGE